jgi:hypothetical protein
MIRKKGNRKKREASESADMFRVWGGGKEKRAFVKVTNSWLI